MGRMLSPEEVAQACGLSRRAVYRAIERGELVASRLCNRLRVREADLDAWVDGQRVEPEPQRASVGPPASLPARGGRRGVLAEIERGRTG